MWIRNDLVFFDKGALEKFETELLDAQRALNKTRGKIYRTEKLHRVNGAGGDNRGRESSDTFDPETHPYHAHLHSSLRAFKPRKWRPLTPDQVPQPSITRCRPVSCKPRLNPTTTDLPQSLRPRPCSATLLLHQKRPDTPSVNFGPFDMLSPRVLAHLVTDPRPLTPLSTYGDVIDDGKSRNKKKRKKGDGVGGGEKRDAQTDADGTRFFDNDGEVSVTSGIESDGLASDDEDDGDDDSSSDDDDDSISELEKGKEPPVDKNRRAPDLHLRPEMLDHVYTPENKRDHARRFDFDASKCEVPAYEFSCPLGPPYDKINFRFHAREGSDWRHTNHAIGVHVPGDLQAMFDRLLEMEKRQIETEDWEERRMKQLAAAAANSAARRRAASRRLLSGMSSSRGGAANGGSGDHANGGNTGGGSGGGGNSSVNSKKCCHSCLQQACVGDCPEKRHPSARVNAACGKCWQLLCTGTCSDVRYDQRMRQPRADDAGTQPLPRYAGPRQCKPCQRRHNAKFINANNVVLGRPASAFSTFSRGKCSAKPRDLRPKSALDVSEGLTKGIERLGLEPTQPTPPSSAKPPRPPSRAGIIPGKSCNSNLSRSLTDLSSKRRRSAKARKRVAAV